MAALLAWWEKINKDKNSKHCHNKWKLFSPFVPSIDGMLGREDLVVLTKLSRLIEKKMDKLILHVQGWINGWIAITVAR